MPVKTTKKTSVKTKSAASTSSKNKETSSKVNKKDLNTKKVVVKRRKLDLTPTRASAAAIASQAHREKKKALIDKLASEERVVVTWDESSNKIPLWVWIFFGCALFIFCVSCYRAYIRPQLGEEFIQTNIDDTIYWLEWNLDGEALELNIQNNEEVVNPKVENQDDLVSNLNAPRTAIETIEMFFMRLSNYQFDEAYDLLTPAMQRSSEIREHFTAFRMNPFVSWLEWDLKPTNFKYISTSTYWKDRYSFDLSYTLASNQETYNETWEFVVDTTWDEPKISRVVCVTSKCSYHPIFWPENFGLMR